jgi:peptide chain release factor 2
VTRETARVGATIVSWKAQREGVDEAQIFLELAEEGDPDALIELRGKAAAVTHALDQLELQQLLGGEHDAGNAIVEIHPGAGGLEAQDWAEMLLRMYLRWAERRGYKTELLEHQPGEGAGLKSATFTLEGPYAYGYGKAESGVHRLVRISPFDANARRQTSFASVLVVPDIEDEIAIAIRDEDLRVDTYRSSGAGGQHVNKTDSAVRLTHLPSGIVVACQNERSQHKNKAMAMKILKARLYELEQRKQQEKMAQITGTKADIGFGHQIRSYVLHPYRMVKDHRTATEVGNADGVLDGDLDPFIDAYLRAQLAGGAKK